MCLPRGREFGETKRRFSVEQASTCQHPGLFVHDLDIARGGIVVELLATWSGRNLGDQLARYQFIETFGEAAFLRIEKLNGLLERRSIDDVQRAVLGVGEDAAIIIASGSGRRRGGVGGLRRGSRIIAAAGDDEGHPEQDESKRLNGKNVAVISGAAKSQTENKRAGRNPARL